MSYVSRNRTVGRALELLALEKGDIIALVVYSGGVGVLYLALPLAAQALFANVAFGTLLQPVVVLATIVFAVLAFSGTLSLLKNVVVERLQSRCIVAIPTWTPFIFSRSDFLRNGGA
jgi:putative ABC transport system ATP-binding protein